MSIFNSTDAFNSQKAAQVAAWFALRDNGSINRLKLMKLMYLAERKTIEQYDMPMFMDKYVSMKHGPVLSRTYDMAKGETQDATWREWIKSIGDFNLACAQKGEPDFNALSRANIKILETVWVQFGHLDQFELAELTHSQEVCPEWEDPGETSKTIPLKRILGFMNKDKSEEIADEIESYRNLSELLNRPS